MGVSCMRVHAMRNRLFHQEEVDEVKPNHTREVQGRVLRACR